MATMTLYYRGEPVQVLVDEQDLVWLATYPWRVSFHGYAYRQDPDRGYVRMHREIMGCRNRSVYVDHVNGNRLDNRRANLRLATPQQNSANNGAKRLYAGRERISQFKGVSFRRGRWRLNIKLPDGTRVDRLFEQELDAARAYDELALAHYGEFARLNFPR